MHPSNVTKSCRTELLKNATAAQECSRGFYPITTAKNVLKDDGTSIGEAVAQIEETIEEFQKAEGDNLEEGG